jgi:uncharacterized protein YdbL (DUF1318 family)
MDTKSNANEEGDVSGNPEPNPTSLNWTSLADLVRQGDVLLRQSAAQREVLEMDLARVTALHKGAEETAHLAIMERSIYYDIRVNTSAKLSALHNEIEAKRAVADKRIAEHEALKTENVALMAKLEGYSKLGIHRRDDSADSDASPPKRHRQSHGHFGPTMDQQYMLHHPPVQHYSPVPGSQYQQTPGPYYSPVPGAQYQPAPGPYYAPVPAAQYQPAPGPYYAPVPAAQYQPAPGPHYAPVPGAQYQLCCAVLCCAVLCCAVL